LLTTLQNCPLAKPWSRYKVTVLLWRSTTHVLYCCQVWSLAGWCINSTCYNIHPTTVFYWHYLSYNITELVSMDWLWS